MLSLKDYSLCVSSCSLFPKVFDNIQDEKKHTEADHQVENLAKVFITLDEAKKKNQNQNQLLGMLNLFD